MALPGTEPRLGEAGKNVVISVCVLLPKMLPDASKTGHRAEVPAPLLMVESAGRTESYPPTAKMNEQEILGCFSLSPTPIPFLRPKRLDGLETRVARCAAKDCLATGNKH